MSLEITNPFVANLTPTAFTLGSVIFAGTNGVLTEDNSFFFWDATNHALGIGTQASVPAAQLEVESLSATNIGVIIRSATSQSASLLSLENSSGQEITNFDSFGHLNISTVSQSTSAATTKFLDINTGHTLTLNAMSLICGLQMSGTYLFAADQTSFNNGGAVQYTPTFKNSTSVTGSLGTVVLSFYNAPIFTADTNAMTMGTLGRGFSDAPTFNRANGGTLAITEWTSYFAGGSSATGVTITNRRGLWIQSVAAGTITTQTALEIDDIANGTTKIAIRQKGTSAHNRLQSNTMFGADSAPTGVVDVTGNFRTIVSSVTFANPCTVTTTASNCFEISAASSSFTVNASDGGLAGQYMLIKWSADSGGSRTITYGTHFSSTGTQTSGGASKNATTLWVSNGTTWYEVARSNNLT